MHESIIDWFIRTRRRRARPRSVNAVPSRVLQRAKDSISIDLQRAE